MIAELILNHVPSNSRLHCCKTKCCCNITTIFIACYCPSSIIPVISNVQVHLCCLHDVIVFLSVMFKFCSDHILISDGWHKGLQDDVERIMVVRHEAIIVNVAPVILDALPDDVITISIAWTQGTHLAVIIFRTKLMIFNTRHNVTRILQSLICDCHLKLVVINTSHWFKHRKITNYFQMCDEVFAFQQVCCL